MGGQRPLRPSNGCFLHEVASRPYYVISLRYYKYPDSREPIGWACRTYLVDRSNELSLPSLIRRAVKISVGVTVPRLDSRDGYVLRRMKNMLRLLTDRPPL